MHAFDDAIRAFIGEEMSTAAFRDHLTAEEGARPDPYLKLLTHYENSDWSEAELRNRVADQFTKRRRDP